MEDGNEAQEMWWLNLLCFFFFSSQVERIRRYVQLLIGIDIPKDGTTVAQLEMVLKMTNRWIAYDYDDDDDDDDDDDVCPATTRIACVE